MKRNKKAETLYSIGAALVLGALLWLAAGCATTPPPPPPPCSRVVAVLSSELYLNGFMPLPVSVSDRDDLQIPFIAGNDMRFILILVGTKAAALRLPADKITDCTLRRGKELVTAPLYLSIILKDFVANN